MRIINILLIILIGLSLTGQNPILQHYDVEDGLPSSLIYDINQDDDGLIWIGTDKGISMYDGKSFTNYTVKNGLPNNDVFGLMDDGDGKLWFNTFDKIAYLKEGQLFSLNTNFDKGIHAHLFLENGFHFIQELTTSENYLVTKDTVLRKLPQFDGGRVISYKNKDHYEAFYNIADNPHIYIVKNGKDNVIETTYNASPKYLKPEKLNGKYFIPQKNGIEIYKDGILNSLNLKQLGLKSEIDRVGYLKNGVLIATVNEAVILNDDLTVSKPLDFLSDLKFNNVYQDIEGNIWIGTGNGLYFLSPQNLKSHSFIFGSSARSMEYTPTKIIKEPDGTILIASYEGMIFQYANGTMTKYRDTKLEGLRDMIRDNYGKLWVASDQFGCLKLEDLKNINTSSCRYDLGKNSNYNTRDLKAIFNVPIKALAMGKDNRMYLAHADGVSRIDFEDGYYAVSTIDSTRSYSIAQDLYGYIWIGRTSGISRFKDGKLVDLGPNHPLNDLSITDVVVDESNGLWIGSDGFGLFHDKGSTMCQIAQLDGVIIKSLFIDDQNQIWAATNQGVVKIIENTDNGIACSYKVDYYSVSRGLASDEVNDIYVQNDTLIAATKRGVSIIPINSSPDDGNASKTPLVIQNIIINGVDQTATDSYQLDYDENDIRIDFAALSYQSLGMLQYQYKMMGIDTSWQVTTSAYREYQALNPGKYCFYLKASDRNGKQIGQERKIDFKISKPWWKTWWFVISCIIISLILLLIYFQSRINRVRRYAEKQNGINQKFAELEMQALRSQMNPHFLFNALHSIQDYIFSNDAREANRYISSFARLMRMILDASREKYIYLDQELEMLQLYIELEQLRFEGKFDYQIKVEDSIDKMTTEIPTLILQPFIENAINHGLMHRKNKGQLRLEISKQQDGLLMIVSDNGIGIQNSKSIKTDGQIHHKSKGVSLIKDRIDLMNEMYDTNITFTISTLDPSKIDFPGTKIDILLPDLL